MKTLRRNTRRSCLEKFYIDQRGFVQQVISFITRTVLQLLPQTRIESGIVRHPTPSSHQAGNHSMQQITVPAT